MVERNKTFRSVTLKRPESDAPSRLMVSWENTKWEVEDPMQRRMSSLLFYRNLSFFGASLVMFGAFVALGDGLRFSITGPLFDF